MQTQLFIFRQRLAMGYRRPERVESSQYPLNCADITKHVTKYIPIGLDNLTEFSKVREIDKIG